MKSSSPVIDLTDVDLFASGRHHETFRWLRANDPVHQHPLPDGESFWALTRYRDVAAAYADPATFSSSGGAMLGGSFRTGADTAAGRMLVASDPPRHRHLRRVIHRVFTPATVERARRQVAVLVDRAVRRMEAAGGADFATDIAPELPAGALMAMAEIPYDEAHRLIGLTRQMIGYRDPTLVEPMSDERLRLAGIQAEIFEFFADLVRGRRRSPGDDMVSILLSATVNGRPLPDEEILYNLMNVAVGGNETSSYTACSGLLALLEHPDQHDALVRRPESLDGAVAEILRWSSTNAYVRRVVVRDTTIGGKLIRAGESVALWNVSANYDEEQFPRPTAFRIDREPNRHLTYGLGVHRCIGAVLAHAELTTLLTRLMPVSSRMRLAGPVRRLRSNFILGTTSMPVRLE